MKKISIPVNVIIDGDSILFEDAVATEAPTVSWVVYDALESDGEGGDKIVAMCDRKEDADAIVRAKELEEVSSTTAWHEKIASATTPSWEHMKAFWVALAMDVTRFYVKRAVR